MKGILGTKICMTQLYTKTGLLVPVTVISAEPNIVTKVLTIEKNGYQALQLGYKDKKKSLHKKVAINNFKLAKTIPKYFVKEIRNMNGFKLGEEVKVSIFNQGELVDVQGISKGHGFSGSIKRHNQKIGPKSHGGGGGSKPIRQTGSIGDVTGNKVFKGMKMPGQFGHVTKTIQNLPILLVDVKNNLLLVKGSIVGPKKSFVVVKQAIKKTNSKTQIEQLLNFDLESKQKTQIDPNSKSKIESKTNVNVQDKNETKSQTKIQIESNDQKNKQKLEQVTTKEKAEK